MPLTLMVMGIGLMAILLAAGHSSAEYTPHDPIEIRGDGAFNASNGVVSGSGTAGDPYIIEGWSVSTSGPYGVRIIGTTKSFIVRHVKVNSSLTNGDAFTLWTAFRGMLASVEVEGTSLKINVSYSQGLVVKDISSDSIGSLTVAESSNVVVSNVTMQDGTFYFVDCPSSSFSDCTLNGETYPSYIDAYGMYLQGCDGTQIAGCSVRGYLIGIVDASYGMTIDGCTCRGNALVDISISFDAVVRDTRMGPRGMTVSTDHVSDIDTSNTVDGRPVEYHYGGSWLTFDEPVGQLFILDCDHVTVSGLTFENVTMAILASDVEVATFRNLVFRDVRTSIRVNGGDDLTINDIEISNHDGPGLYAQEGIYATNAGVITIKDTTITGGKGYGLRIELCNDTTVWNCTFDRLIGQGIWLKGPASPGSPVNASIGRCTFSYVGQGITASRMIAIVIKDSAATDCNGAGFNLTVTEEATLQGCTARNCSVGFWIEGSKEAALDNCSAINCTWTGIHIRAHEVLTAHLVSDRIVGAASGYELISDMGLASELTFEDNSAERCGIGMRFIISEATLRRCDITNCSWVGFLCNESRINLERFNVSRCGIGLMFGSRALLMSVKDSVISRCGVGVVMEGNGLSVTYCTVMECTDWALRCESTAGSGVHHNSMVMNNYDQSSETYKGPQAFFGSQPPYYTGEEGNYWSDYRDRYPNAKARGRVWDTPYELAGNQYAMDPYPLVAAYDPAPPVAVAGDDMTIPQNTTIALNATRSWDNVGVTSFLWSFNYSGREWLITTPVAPFTFDVVGTYWVKLTVWDAYLNMATDGLSVTVVDTLAPIAEAGDDIQVDMGLPFKLDASGSWDHVGIVRFEWTIDPGGMGKVLDLRVATFTIEAAGDYKAVLNVSDAAGNWATDSTVVHVIDTEPPVARAGPDQTIDQGSSAVLDGAGSTDNVGIVGWNWSLDEGEGPRSLAGANVTILFRKVGVFVVTLVVTDARGLASSDTMTVTVLDAEGPVARIGERVVVVPQHSIVTMDASASTDNVGIVSYAWTFEYNGELRRLEGAATAFVFDAAGAYLVTLTVADAMGNEATDTLTVTVEDITDPQAEAGPDIVVGQHEPVMLDGRGSSDNVGIASFVWTFEVSGSPVRLEGGLVNSSVPSPGVIRVTLTVTDRAGNTATDTLTLRVMDTEPPVACAGKDTTVKAGTTLRLTAFGSSDNVGIVSFSWRFLYGGQQVSLAGQNRSFLFGEAGTYNVTLEVRDAEGNPGTDCILVTVLPPEAPDGGEGFPWTVALLLLAAAMAFCVVVALVLRGRRER